MDADQLIAWLRAAGYHPGQHGAPLTRSSVAKFLKSETQPFWDAIVQHFPTKRDVSGADSRAPAPAQSSPEQDRAALQKQQEHNAQLQALVNVEQEKVTRKATELTGAEALNLQLQQQLESTQKQSKLLPLLEHYVERLRSLITTARTRAAGTDSQGPHAQLLEQLCSRLQEGLAEHTDLWLARQPDDDAHMTASQPSAAKCIITMPASVQSRDVLEINFLAPTTLISLISKMLQHGLETLQSIDPHHQQDSNQTHTSGASTRQPPYETLLQQRQQAHVNKFILTENLLNQQEDVRGELDQLKGTAQSLLQWPYNQHKLQEACLAAEVSCMRDELSRLREEYSACQAMDQSNNELFGQATALANKDIQLARLIRQLLYDRATILARWTAEEKEHQVWVQQHLPTVCRSVKEQTDDSKDMLVRECDAGARIQQASLQPHVLVPGLPMGGAAGAGRVPKDAEADLQMPTLQLFQHFMPAVGAGLSKQLVISGTLAAPGQTPPGRTRGPTPVHNQMVVALKACCAMDVMAPLRCPSALLSMFADHQAYLRSWQVWLAAAQPWLEAAQQRVDAQAARHKHVKQVVGKARADDKQRRLEVKGWLDRSNTSISHVQENLMAMLEDYKTLPAVNLLPEFRYAGLSAQEWLAVIQELHASIAEVEQRAKAKQQGNTGGLTAVN